MREKFINALADYLCKSPIWLMSLGCMILQGVVIQVIVLGFTKKLKKFIKLKYALPIGAGSSCIAFLVQNIDVISRAQLTIQIIEERILSSIFLSFGVVGIVAMIVLPIREILRLKGRKEDGHES